MRELVIACVLGPIFLSGCYLSHARPETPDGGVDAPSDGGVADAPDARDGFVEDAVISCDPAEDDDMVGVTTDHAFRIDVTEVTREAYARFLACGGRLDARPECASASLEPGPLTRWDSDDPRVPVHDVSFCAAASYCAWAGKRLCRLEDEWGPACAATESRVWPVFRRPEICVLSGYGDGDWRSSPGDVPVAVGSAPECRGIEGPFDGVYDLVGNAAEFLVDEAGRARYAGASSRSGFGSSVGGSSLCIAEALPRPDERQSTVGFRCCAD